MRRLVALLVVAAALGACGNDPSDPGGTPVGVNGSESPGGAGADLFDVGGTDIDGNAIDLVGYAGRDVVVWFWAPW